MSLLTQVLLPLPTVEVDARNYDDEKGEVVSLPYLLVIFAICFFRRLVRQCLFDRVGLVEP